MSKRTRKIVGLLMGLLMILSVVAPAAAMAAVQSSTARPDKGDLIINKVQYNTPGAPVLENDGLELELPSGVTPLDGVTFEIYKVADDAEMPVNVDGMMPYATRVTADGGIARFNDLPAGRYYVKEAGLPSGVVETSPPFLVDVPMMNPNGREWNTEVYVYPKNQLILGSVELEKVDEDGDTLDGAEFDLYKVTDSDEILINTDGPLVTVNGLIRVDGLEVGDYYFREVKAPEGFGLDTRAIPFSITLEDHDVTIEREKVNFALPEIEKFVSEIGQLEDSADFFERVTWFIRADIPGNIVDAESYVITDTFPNALTFDGNLIVTADGEEFTAFTVSGVELGDEGGTVVFTFDVEALDDVDEIIISFDTFINKNAVMGIDYENKVQLDYNNGYDIYTSFPEEDPFVNTGGKPFLKVNASDEGLPGAEFVIFNADGEYLQEDYSWGPKSSAWVFISGSDGSFEVKGLAYGSYSLEEIKAPEVDGVQYRLLGEPVPFTINAMSYYSNPMAITDPDADPTAAAAEIENRPEMRLPQTGGMGTLLFSILGLGLMGTSAKLYKKSEKK